MANTFRSRLSSPVSPISAVPVAMTHQSSEYKHDVMSLQIPTTLSSTASPYVTGLPVMVQWAGAPRLSTFYGYIDTVSAPYDRRGPGTQQLYIELRCVGATYPLKAEDNKTFTDMAVDACIAQIAKQFQLASLVEPSAVAWPTLPQRGMSWWAFLIALTKRIGYTLYPRDAGIVAVDRRLAFASAPSFTYNVVQRPLHPYDVISFTPEASSGDGLGGARPGTFVVKGTSAFSGREFQVARQNDIFTGTTQVYAPQFQRIVDEAPRTIGEANAYLDAAQACNMFTQRARIFVRGNASVKVGMALNLVISQNPTYAGTWFVMDVKHRVSRTTFVTEIEIGKDAAGVAAPPPPKGFTLSGPYPGVVFRNNQWTAAWSTS